MRPAPFVTLWLRLAALVAPARWALALPRPRGHRAAGGSRTLGTLGTLRALAVLAALSALLSALGLGGAVRTALVTGMPLRLPVAFRPVA